MNTLLKAFLLTLDSDKNYILSVGDIFSDNPSLCTDEFKNMVPNFRVEIDPLEYPEFEDEEFIVKVIQAPLTAECVKQGIALIADEAIVLVHDLNVLEHVPFALRQMEVMATSEYDYDISPMSHVDLEKLHTVCKSWRNNTPAIWLKPYALKLIERVEKCFQ
jgi:hypothetical protein